MTPANVHESAIYSSCTDTPSAESIDVCPDGGLEAWMVVIGVWGTAICSWGWINSVGVFQEYYEANILKEYPPATVSWILCLEAFFLLSMTPIIGKLFDRYGPRWLLLIGTFLHVFGLLMASISTEYYQLLLSQGVCSAIGASLIFLPAFNCIVGYFDQNRSTAFGSVATGSSIGGVVFPVMVSRLIESIGFPWAMRATALFILVVLIMANLVVKSRIPLNPSPFSIQEYLAPFRELPFFLASLGNILFAFGSFIPVTYLVAQARSGGMEKSLAQYLISMINGASLISRVVAGVLGDKAGPFNVWVTVNYAAGTLILALWIPATSNEAIIAFAILFGFSFGAYASVQPVVVAQISPIQDIGIRTGLYFAVSSGAQLVSGPVAGHILSASRGSYLGMKILAGLLCLTGATIGLAAKFHAVGFKPMAKF